MDREIRRFRLDKVDEAERFMFVTECGWKKRHKTNKISVNISEFVFLKTYIRLIPETAAQRRVADD